ncbi:SpaA isopeptide-forming pilin-related protein [Lagierella massiliensis]|uniref:SpaA isopeptide-forming pilin-related protein n=1 Tax=Lagierella massiliensis TaxID=1689303 RepID=UPI0006D7EFFD|nr:SpaA isopeptide-forming pilin-related protein [Lagierella massiliensis]
MDRKILRRISSGLLSLLLVMQVLVQPVMAVQNTNDLPKEVKTQEVKKETHSKEGVIDPAIKEELSPLEQAYIEQLEDNSFAFLRGPYVISSQEDFDLREYTFVEKDEEGKVLLVRGDEVEDFSNIEEITELVERYRQDYKDLQNKETKELNPTKSQQKINYKDYKELSIPIVINDIENKYESTKNENITLKRDKEEQLTKEIFVNSLKDLEDILLTFKGEKDIKDLDITKVEKVYTGEEDEDTLTVEEVLTEALEEGHQNKNKVTSLNIAELYPGYKYIFTISSKKVKEDNTVLTEITTLEKDKEEAETEELGKAIVEEEKETESTEATDKKEENKKENRKTSPIETDNIKEDKKQEINTSEDNKEKVQEFEKAFDDTKEEVEKNSIGEEDKEENGLVEGIKKLLGLTDLQKADRELKSALKDENNGLEEIQNILTSFEEKYELSKADKIKLMEDNEDAFKALIEKKADSNFNPQMLLSPLRAGNDLNLDGKKFTIMTRFDTSTVVGPIKKDQYFMIHLDKELKVNNPSGLEPIKYKGNVIATPEYDATENTIKYTIQRDITEEISIPLNIPVDYNPENIVLGNDGTFTVTNKISGFGVKAPKDLVPQKVDKNGNLAGSIIEPDRDDVQQIVDGSGGAYKFDMNVWGEPVVENGKLKGFNWSVTMDSDKDLKDYFGMKLNLTTVKGSGLGEIQNLKLNGESIDNEVIDQLDGSTGIVDSKHHAINKNTANANYTFYTPVKNIQGSYMLDVSTLLSKQNKKGAVRTVIDEGYSQDKIEAATPTRVGINNRTTIQGKFTTNTTAEWTITDGVSSKDVVKGLPLQDRDLIGNQTINSGKRVVYGIDDKTGQMVVKEAEKTGLTSIPTKETDPNTSQEVGNIGVYEFQTNITNPDQAGEASISGVEISKYKDIHINQNWNLPNGQKMPAQTITVTDKNGNKTETKVNEGPVVTDDTGKQRLITVPDVRYWDVDDSGNATFRDHKISQTFPEGKVTIAGKEYKYSENANYFRPDTRIHYIQNSLEESTDKKPATFTVVKVDSNNPEKRISGANFDLLGANVSITTDSNGEATFRNIKPGKYYLRETKAPEGYKLDNNEKTITVSDQGEITVTGENAKLSTGSGKTEIVQHSDYPNWPDYMNTMHYGKLDENGNLEFYIFLKPYAPRESGRTDRDTRLDIVLPGVDLTNSEVKIYDVYPYNRDYIKGQMEAQTMDKVDLGNDITGVANNNGAITGTENFKDPYTGKTGYKIYLPENRFGTDWGFLVKVNANVGASKDSTVLSYDWLSDTDTAAKSKIQEIVTISTNSEENGSPTLTISNDPFEKSPIEVAKFANTFSEVEVDGKKVQRRDRLQGAEFVLKDVNGDPIANKFTDDKGNVSFGDFPPGTYYLEEKTAPVGYEKSDVYFEVTVNEKGEVTYKAKFKTSSGTPVPGQDYFIEQGEESSSGSKVEVKEVHQHMDVKDSGRGKYPGMWEAYELESLKYKLDARLNIEGPGARFEIQFDKNLDFTQYFTEFPDLVEDGKVIAKPYFDHNTKLLTYVFTENATKGETTISLDLIGMIPSKYYAPTHGTYKITNVVAPGQTITDPNSNQTETIDVLSYYGEYDAKRDFAHKPTGAVPSQLYYFREVYQKDNGDWYVTALAYYNPLGNYTGASKQLTFNWMSTNYQSDKIQHNWNANGNTPAFELENVKVYRTDKDLGTVKYRKGNNATVDTVETVSNVMPLSMGIRPDQYPNTYRKVFETTINSDYGKEASSNNIYLTYDPSELTRDAVLQEKSPLKITMPRISPGREGYVIEQTFKIPDIKKFNENWRAFYMGQDTSLRSTFVTGPNKNYSNVDQTGGEIPKFYKEVVGIINKKFTPGQFKITKSDDNTGAILQGAVFALTNSNGKTIYKTSDSKGLVEFTNLSPGRYTLKETKAPEGYIGTNEKWEVIVYNNGYVRIEETSILGSGNIYTGNNDLIINIPVANRKVGEKFQVFKKDESGNPLQGATFTITKQGETTPVGTATSKTNGIVEFNEALTEGTYIIEETNAPDGYKKLDKKWVLIIDKDGNKKVYNYSLSTGDEEKSLLGEPGTYRVNVKERTQTGWDSFDNRITGWAANSTNAEHLGTRIIAINKDKKYVIQRYVLNPEAKNIDATTTATIHREKPNYPNMDWYKGDEEYKVFTLEAKEGGNTDGKVTGLISDLRLADYNVTDITNTVTKSKDTSHVGETRLKLNLPATNTPIVVDVKVPYKSEYEGVGTGMDWREGGITYWKSDYYERVSDILLGDLYAAEEGTITGSYIGKDSLDVTNEAKTYGFKLKKVKDGETTTVIPGAVFKLTGPDESQDERTMTTGKDGMISFDGLKPGTYKLEEIEPAPGYEKTDTTWVVRITSDGRAYIKSSDGEKVSIVEAKATQNSTFANTLRGELLKTLNMPSENSGLEIGDQLVDTDNPLRAADVWEVIDPAITSGLTDKSNNDVQTKITEINKGTHQFKQVFLINVNSFSLNSTGFDIHREPEDRSMDPSDIISYKIQAVGKGSTLNNIIGIPKDIKIKNNNFASQPKDGKPNASRALFASRINTPILVEIVTNYDPTKAFGLGMNFYDEGMGMYAGPGVWGAQSYSSDTLINKKQTYSLEIEPSLNGNVTANKASDISEGEQVVLTVNPKQGYKLQELKVDGKDVTTSVNENKYIFNMLEHNVKVSALFTEESYAISYQTPQHGVVQVPDTAKYGDTVTITAIPETGYMVDTIKVNSGSGAVPVTGNTFVMPADNVVVDVTFKVKPAEKYNITVNQTTNGSVKPDKNSAEENEVVTLTVTPDDGYEVDSVTMNEQALIVDADGKYKFTMPKGDATVSATFKKIEDQPGQDEIEIPDGSAAQITNKQTGLDLKVFKVNYLNRRLPDAEFAIEKYKDETYKELDDTFTKATGISNEDGVVEFRDKDGNIVSLPVGHYLLTETKSPSGYKAAQAPWKVEVYQEDGQLKAKYTGPEDTPAGLLNSNKANDKNDITTTANGIKYKARLTYINTESKTYIQRIYIDTRGYTGTAEKINVQITPKHKRDETDAPGRLPVTNVEGVKTAYRSTYKISGAEENPDVDEILRYYDLSKPKVSMINTARWRPFDWGFDEDLLNLDKGVYYIDVEGFYDDAIITGYDSKQGKNTIPAEDLGKLDLNIDFYDGERKFQQVKGKNGDEIIYNEENGGSYLDGNIELGYVEKNAKGENVPTAEGKVTPPGAKYPLWIGKEGGRIYPPLDGDATKTRVQTSIDISSLYSSDTTNAIPQDGMTIQNDEETYNITFSKHGRDNATDDINSEAVTNNRLEGGIFKLQEDTGITYEDIPGSFVASAFNGYFGFRGLKPGRYRLIEVKSPEGYVPITDPLLYFTVETITTNSGKIVHPVTGNVVDIKTIKVKFPGNDTVYNLSDLSMVDPEDNTKTVLIKNIDSKKINIEKAQIVDPTDDTKRVPLNKLTVPGAKEDYAINQIKIVPDSSGYISLEYDKANGVYQYVPEKSTNEEDGRLIDYVTSATAKNMGKIINEKPGEGSITIKKVDQDGNLLKASGLLPGAVFKLTNLSNGQVKPGTVGTDGTLTFDKLQIGNYRLEETKSPNGYENTNQVWNFTVGGKDLDPYSEPVERTGVDLTNKISLKTEKVSVLNPDEKTSTDITENDEIHPHFGESIEFENKFKLAPDTKINPGDYFTLKMSDNIDLNGIFEKEIENLDILAPGVGTIAKADYNRKERTITYTFTNYAKTYTLVDFSNKLTAFIDLYKVKKSDGLTKQKVGFRLGEDKSQYKDVKVVYDLLYAKQDDGFGNNINLESKIVKYDPNTGEFLQYYYVNRLKENSTGPIELLYEADRDIDNLNISVSRLVDNSNVEKDMPESFGVDENSSNLSEFKLLRSFQTFKKGEKAGPYFGSGMTEKDSYIVKVTGRATGTDKTEYNSNATMYKYNEGYTPSYAFRRNSVRYFRNEATAKAELEIRVVNPENKITFNKVDQNGKALAGAKFKLEYRAKDTDTWTKLGQDITTGADGVFSFTKLRPGKYQLIEIEAPSGYKIAPNPIIEFAVDKNGKITRNVTSSDGKTTTKEDIGGATISIVNRKEEEIEFKKVDATDKTVLEGAEFEVWYKVEKNGEYTNDKLKLYQDDSGNKLVIKAGTEAPKGYTEVKTFTTDKDGIVKFKFYEPGYYALKEVKAPEGYINPRKIVKEFAVLDGVVQTYKYKTELDVSKTKSWDYSNDTLNDVYGTDITMRFNNAHEKITYEQDKSKITLSGLPLDNDFKAKNNLSSDGITISAKLVNKNNQSSRTKIYTLDAGKDYTNNKGTITIDLYELVKELERKTGDSITSENTIELSMYSTLALDTTLDIKSNIVISDEIKEDRTFQIGTEGDKKVDHSYSFTTLGETTNPIEIKNKKGLYPGTGSIGALIFAIIGAGLMTVAYVGYKRKKVTVTD